jgi:SAM-dependent methyltransferase
MDKKARDEIQAAVRAAYSSRAEEVRAGQGRSCDGDGGCGCGAGAVSGCQPLYDLSDAAGLPDTAVSFGCGNPLALAGLQPGEIVLDLGSGAGLDCFLAARAVGPAGHVIGLDMTDAMLDLAQRNRDRIGLTNVEFHKGTIEAIPLADCSVDVVISNCVINLSPEKDAVFREVARVLRPGGRLHVADIVLLAPLAAAQQADLDLWAGCVSGALRPADYADRLQAAGLVEIEVRPAGPAGAWPDQLCASASITARRPGGKRSSTPRRTVRR